MYIRDILSLRISKSVIRYIKPISLWLSGFLLGCLIARSAEPPVYSLVLRAVQTPMSIDGLLTAYFLPFLIAAVAARFHHGSWLLAVSFAKAFTYAYLACCLVISQKSAWLLLPLFLFSDLFTNILLLWMSVCEYASQASLAKAIPMITTVAAACLDFFVISPFLAEIAA